MDCSLQTMAVQDELTLKNQGQHFYDSCSRTACVVNAGSVGLITPHLGKAPQQVLGTLCKVAGSSHGLSPCSQEQALLPNLVSFSASELGGLQINFK